MAVHQKFQSLSQHQQVHLLGRVVSGDMADLRGWYSDVENRGAVIDLLNMIQPRFILQPDFVGFAIDMSRDGEAGYLHRRHLQKGKDSSGRPRYAPTIVDVGANDGWLVSVATARRLPLVRPLDAARPSRSVGWCRCLICS